MKKKIVAFIFMNMAMILFSQDNWFKAQTDVIDLEWVSASSELVEGQYDGKYLYSPINIFDNDFTTTWCEAHDDGSGIGEVINIQFKEPVSFDEIQLVNGFASGQDYYHKNNRVKKITLTQVADKHFQRKDYTLKDDMQNWQAIKFGLLQTAQTITIKIDEVYRGYRYDDTCLSDIRFLYKEKVIPVKNVAEIKKVQEETSRTMLKTDMASFKLSFNALFKGKDYLYLKEPGSPRGYRVYLKNYNLELVNYSKPFEDEDLLSWMKSNVSSSFYYSYFEGYKKRNYDFLALGKNNSGEKKSYELGNFRLIETAAIDYIETKRTLIIKLSGEKGLYLNGVFYDILNAGRVLYYKDGK
ncbi:MAG: nicotine adenine dinucleotide glycohydrolase [Spirochaetales bacterium]|nr:nicotine adenine dinucleotide glycohydrolase [Spirochaetales bacterium]